MTSSSKMSQPNETTKLRGSARAVPMTKSASESMGIHRPYSPHKNTLYRVISPNRVSTPPNSSYNTFLDQEAPKSPAHQHENYHHHDHTQAALPFRFSNISYQTIASDSEEESFSGRDPSIMSAISDHYSPPTSTDVAFKDLLPYYLPCASWIPHYCWNFFIGDFMSGLSLVFFQLPLAMSYTSMAHVPVLCGLFSLGIAPLIYAVLGSVPQMIVGPEAAISLVIGQALEPILAHDADIDPIDLVVAVTSVAGLSLFAFGIGRLGYLDNVLSAALLKGFISAVGMVMVIGSLIAELGLTSVQALYPSEHVHTPVEKILFLFRHRSELHQLTTIISLVSFLTLMLLRNIKKQLEAARFHHAVFIPDIFIVSIICTVLSRYYGWDQSGVAVVGAIKTGEFHLTLPFTTRLWPLMKQLTGPAIMSAMLGFFESTTASKSLGSTYDLPISSNRELIALGSINLICSIFGTLPAFGGYGRSKINAISAKTCASGMFMGLFTLLAIFFLLDSLYHLPKCVLSVITTVIGLSLMEEAPSDLHFHWNTGGYNEIVTFCLTFCATVFYSSEAGIALGIGYSVIRVIKHSAASRIQILGRVPHTDIFINADVPVIVDENLTMVTTELEEIEGCLIVKVPEPLTFTNTADLKARLRRVELYGSTRSHPALPRARSELMARYVIFDLHGLTELDSSAAQILLDLLEGYKSRSILVLFARVPNSFEVRERLRSSGITDLLERCLGDLHSGEMSYYPFFNSIADALKTVDDIEVSSTFEDD